MTVIKFAGDFTRLIIRYKTKSKNNPSDDVVPLSDEEILFTVHYVLQALSMKGIEDKNNLLETPNGTNTVGTPETLVVNIESDSEDACRSQDVLSVCTNNDITVSVSPDATQKEQGHCSSIVQNEKKFVSRSNPAICVNKISRSDTFVHEESQNINTKKQKNVSKDLIPAKTYDLPAIIGILTEIVEILRELFTSI
ncbi:PREDICTED: uncharacterized protein LOC105562433 [Vollenhovia emeryi]|uniref:uncharacterized protein LOC105562433 n=1 Tax=Vollenhovia emeryi TaxID=411798 RepID=UPI0005F52FB0|nr:PREDICTED: uncharacterized protein LOC105562433 [Vollenhovia emeryi]XP_011868664.1 PREDICTED: uncharacterized protein LOC105562433 [Vollenhovia emeryi]